MWKMVLLQAKLRMALRNGVPVDEEFVKTAFLEIDNATDADIQAWSVTVDVDIELPNLPDDDDGVWPGLIDTEPSGSGSDGAESSDSGSGDDERLNPNPDEAQPSDSDSDSDSDVAEQIGSEYCTVEHPDSDCDIRSLGSTQESGSLCGDDEPINFDDDSDFNDVNGDHGSLDVQYPSSDSRSEWSENLDFTDDGEIRVDYWNYIGNGYWINPFGEAIYWVTPFEDCGCMGPCPVAWEGYWTSLFVGYGIWGNPFVHSTWINPDDRVGYWVGAWNDNGDFEGEYFLYNTDIDDSGYHYWMNPDDGHGYLRGRYNDDGVFDGEYVRYADHCATCSLDYVYGSGPEPPAGFPYRGPDNGHDYVNSSDDDNDSDNGDDFDDGNGSDNGGNGSGDDNGDDYVHVNQYDNHSDDGYDLNGDYQSDGDQEANDADDDADDEGDDDDEPNDNEEASSSNGNNPAGVRIQPGGDGEETTPEVDWGGNVVRGSDSLEEVPVSLTAASRPTGLARCSHCIEIGYRGICRSLNRRRRRWGL
ncbi:hypothetical protein P167DRAFT_538514 [Morchella conica CCBAS932]|uniref:Uncharacterized protein n=1 Tax=Morchella conica CCBAS932 TaxID=1392247 RepID=A0A3N4KFY4_9PEZI|nr:hypothetical protein P167DRAFT_538514 [Morchella conica CCBAS932]